MTMRNGDRPGALVVSEVFPPAIGGSGELLSNVYRRFKDITVTVLTDGTGQRIDAVDAAFARVVREPMRAPYWGLTRPRGLRHHLAEARRLRRLCGEARTIVYCARALPEGIGAWIARRLGGAPYVVWAHGEDIAAASSSREFTLLMRRVYQGATTVIANSRNTASMLQRVGVTVERIEVVHPGVDATVFRPDAPGAPALRSQFVRPDELLLLTVGRLQRRKGHDLVLRALAGLENGLQLRYLIIGDGEERPRLERMVVDLKLGDRVRFAGVVPGEVLPVYYAAADIFVHPNRIDGIDIEGFGIVFLEAAASEVPVIAGTSGGTPEAVAADRTGLLVSGTSVEELQQALRRLAGSPPLRRSLGAAGRARALREFSWDRAVRQVSAVHDHVAGFVRQP
jgi:phosphatidylinositol alpha-1,6-mannosyltransferase